MPIRPASHDGWQFTSFVWDACDIQRAGDDDFVVEDAIAGDLDVAAGGDGALGFAFDAFVGVGLVDAGVIGGVAVVFALGGSGGADCGSYICCDTSGGSCFCIPVEIL